MTDVSPETIGADFVPVRAPQVYTVSMDGEAVLLDERENRLHLLNRSAALLWWCFDGHATVHDLAAELSEELDHHYDRLLAETLTIVRDLGREGLLDHVEPVAR